MRDKTLEEVEEALQHAVKRLAEADVSQKQIEQILTEAVQWAVSMYFE